MAVHPLPLEVVARVLQAHVLLGKSPSTFLPHGIVPSAAVQIRQVRMRMPNGKRRTIDIAILEDSNGSKNEEIQSSAPAGSYS